MCRGRSITTDEVYHLDSVVFSFLANQFFFFHRPVFMIIIQSNLNNKKRKGFLSSFPCQILFFLSIDFVEEKKKSRVRCVL